MKIPQINIKGENKSLDALVDKQIVKILEEFGELRDVVCNIRQHKNAKQRIIDEGNDLKTAVDTLFYLFRYTQEELKAHRVLHEQKLEIRDIQGKIKIDEWIEV